jgi:peptidoglycan hydrolase-like protein with peptidoglycan-binding domain
MSGSRSAPASLKVAKSEGSSVMKYHSLTSAIALALATGLAGAAYAQQSVAPGTAGPPETQNAAPGAAPPAASAPATETPGVTPNASAAAAPAPGAGAARVTRATVQEAQQHLKSQGLYDGAIDGRVGPQTRQALRKFQQQNGLAETARFDQPTLQRLLHGSS